MMISDAEVPVAPTHRVEPASAPRSAWRRLRLVPLAAGAIAMALGLWSGLTRLGLVPGGTPALTEYHAALMISGFLGTLISLERAVALGRSWTYAAPGLSSLGFVALLAGLPRAAALLFIAAAAILLLASIRVVLLQFALFTVVLAVAAACWGAGTGLWLAGHSTPAVVGWWLDFLILTIAAERLELSRIARPPPISQIAFALAVVILLVGAARGEFAGVSAPWTAVGLLCCAAWLLRHDIARRTVFLTGQPRFSACAILAGHVWLAVAGLLLLLLPPWTTAFSYDAAVHAIAIGFVLSMIFAHAPLILPAVTGVRVRYTPFAYGPLALLHASVALRVGSDVLDWVDLRAISGLITVLALVTYAATLFAASWRHPPRNAPRIEERSSSAN